MHMLKKSLLGNDSMQQEESASNRKRPGELKGEADKSARLDKRNERDKKKRNLC